MTIADVTRAAGVSTQTVSRVINNKDEIMVTGLVVLLAALKFINPVNMVIRVRQ